MAFSKVTLIQRVRTILNDNPYLDVCTEAMDTTEVALDVADGTLWSAGDIVEFQDDGEQCYVQSIATNTLTVIRNYNYSVTATAGTGTSHSINAQIAKSPLYPYASIVDAINMAIRDLWPYVYRELNQTITPVVGQHYYEIDEATTNSTEIKELSSVVQVYNTNKLFRYGENGASYPAKLVFNVPAAIAASGVALYLPYLYNSTESIYVNGIAAITPTVATGSYSYLNDGHEADCVAYFAASRLILWSDAFRTVAQDVSMGDQTVGPGARTRLSAYYEQKAIECRRQWEEELKLTLPRIPKWRKNGRRQA